MAKISRKREPAGATDAAPPPAERKAAGVDAAIKEANLNRLKRIEGQVRGVQRMVEEDRYCADILTQVAAIRKALQAVSKELVRNHLRHCVAHATRSADSGGDGAQKVYDELVDLMYRD